MRGLLLRIYSRIKNRPRGTIRVTFSLFGLLAFLGASVISGTGSSYIRLVANQTTVEAGERFSIDVYANAHVPVNAVDITIRFDGDLVTIKEVDRGQSVLTIWTEDPIIEKNSLTLRGGTFRRGFIGEHKIATIDLEAVKTGSSEFNTEQAVLLAGDGRGTPVRLDATNTSAVSLLIYDENTTPGSIGVDVQIVVITDIDGDGSVTLKDISSFMASWNSQDKIYDFNGDRRMTFKDFSIILADFVF